MTGRRALLTAALGFARLQSDVPEIRPLRRWLDSWAGLGAVVDGMARLGFDVALTRHGDGGTPWRALFYPGGFVHVTKAGSAWGATPWRAVQGAAWEALGRSHALCLISSYAHILAYRLARRAAWARKDRGSR